MFQHTADELKQAAQAALELAKQKGATAAEVDLSESLGQNVQVRWREIEQIEYQQDQSLDITVFVGHSKGRASTADLSPQALASTVQAACDIARYTAAERATRRLSPQTVATGNYPILFDAAVAGSLIGHIVGGLNGGALYRQSSFLQDSLGTQILPSFISLREEPHIPRALGSTYFDSEGVATRPRFVIENGIVRGYFLDSYSARKLNQTSTGNAGGAHNLYLTATADSQTALLNQMGTGLLITELMGQGVNMLTGDYSRGAAGFWVENGIIRHAVSGITIAGSLKEMLRNIVATGSDFRRNASSKIGSILISNMTVAGA